MKPQKRKRQTPKKLTVTQNSDGVKKAKRAAKQPRSTVSESNQPPQSPTAVAHDIDSSSDPLSLTTDRQAKVASPESQMTLSVAEYSTIPSSSQQQNNNGGYNLVGLNKCANANTLLQGPLPLEAVESVFDPISTNVPLKLKEKIWNGEFVDISLMLKSNHSLNQESNLDGDLVVKGGVLSVVTKRPNSIRSIQVWTSAFMVYASVMLEKWPNKGSEFLKYMHIIRLAASRGCNQGWISYDEQFRLKKSRAPVTSWGLIDNELWMLYVTTPNNGTGQGQFWSTHRSTENLGQNSGDVSTFSHNNAYKNMSKVENTSSIQKFAFCRYFNRALTCTFGRFCKFTHKCQKCRGNHPAVKCNA